MAFPIPPDEAQRIEALRRYGILDTPAEQSYDDLTRVAAHICRTPVSLVTLIDSDRQWFKSRFGVEGIMETPRELSFCAHAIMGRELMVVQDTAADERFKSNPLVAGDPGVRFYAGAPLVTPDGYALGTLCAIDMTPRSLTEEQENALKSLARQAVAQMELRLNYARLQDLERLRDNLTSMLVHDMRTPLTSYLTGLQTLQMMGDLKPDQAECVDISVNGGKTLLGMINDLLDIGKLEDGSLQLERSRVSLDLLAHQALAQVSSLALAREIQVTSEIAADLPTLFADEEKLTRVLVNLLGNAIKFTPPNGLVGLTVCRGRGEDAVQISISDTGEGIPADSFDLIFEKFGQVADRKAGRRKSTGLGLTFCKMMVEAHGGRIWLESTMGEGTTFRFTLPTGSP